jgi:hypothetical protein
MALAEFLKAFKDIIVANQNLPESQTERFDLFRSRYPALSELEVEDLAKIPPNRFGIYTGTICRGEANILANRFPVTFAGLRSFYLACKTQPFNSFLLLVELNQQYTWKSYQTNELADNFVAYVQKLVSAECAEHQCFQWIPEMADFEGRLVKIKKSKNILDQVFFNWQQLTNLSVQECLKLQIRTSVDAIQIRANYDLPSIQKSFRSNDKCLPTLISKNPSFVWIGRNQRLFSRAKRVEAAENEFLSSTLCKPRNLEEYCSVLLESQPELATQPELLFSNSLERVRELVMSGILRVYLPS